MPEIGGPSDLGAAITLSLVSFLSFLAGGVLRRWPDKVREYLEPVDGSLIFLTPEAHLALVTASAWALHAVSMAALVAAALLL
jgi:hypothetical protein